MEQTLDNNFSAENRQENEQLTQELAIRMMNLMAFNEFKTKTLIKYHIIDWEYQNNKKFIPEFEAKKEADITFQRYKSLGYINVWNNFRDDLAQYIG